MTNDRNTPNDQRSKTSHGSTNTRVTDNMTAEEKQRMHEAYSEMGRKGGEKGGRIRAEQMAREGFTDKSSDKAPKK